MILRCIRDFGHFKPGATVEARDGAVFDTYYFEKVAPAPKPKPKAAPKEEDE